MGTGMRGPFAIQKLLVWLFDWRVPFPVAARLCLKDLQDLHHTLLTVPVSRSHDTKTHRN